mgnify:CR=1 FL=1
MALGTYPEKSWSLSKHKEYVECRRKYFFSTFEQWGGWELVAPERKQRAYRLKKLNSFHAFVGTLIHNEIAAALKGLPFTVEKSLSNVEQQLRHAFDDSITRQSRWEMNPKSLIMFQEVYYERSKWDKQAIDSEIVELVDKARTCLNNFIASNSFHELKKGKCRIIEIEKGFPSFDLNGLKVYSVIDLLFERSDSSVWIIDWKTGKQNGDNEERQLKIYSMYVHNKYKKSIEHIYTVSNKQISNN